MVHILACWVLVVVDGLVTDLVRLLIFSPPLQSMGYILNHDRMVSEDGNAIEGETMLMVWIPFDWMIMVDGTGECRFPGRIHERKLN